MLDACLKTLKSNKLFFAGITFVILLLATVAFIYSFNVHTSIQKQLDLYVINDKAVFEPVLPDYEVTLPQDFAFHNEFHQEQWQYFASLQGVNGTDYSVQWTYRRVATDENTKGGWNSSQIYISSIVIASKDNIWRAHRLARGGIGQAGFIAQPFRLWLDNWSWQSTSSSPLPGILSLETDDFSVKLRSTAKGPFVLNGDNGYIKMHDLLPFANYGFQTPFVRTIGDLVLDGHTVNVTGRAWLSKQWHSEISSSPKQNQTILNISLKNGRSIILTQNIVTNHAPYTFGSIIDPDGTTIELAPEDISMVATEYIRMPTGKRMPLKWEVSISKFDIEFEAIARRSDLWPSSVVSSWQGPITFLPNAFAVQGVLQLTGY